MALERGAGRRPPALDGWRAAVHEYVKCVNEAEIDMHVGPLAAIADDRAHLDRLEARLARMRERELRRGAHPVRHEARAELLAWSEDGDAVSVRLRLHLKRSLSFGGAAYTEEKLETEHIRLERPRGAWRVTAVEPEIAERRPEAADIAERHPSDGTGDIAERLPSAAFEADRRPFAAAADAPHTPDDDSPADARSAKEREGPALPPPYINSRLLPHFRTDRAGIPYRRDLAAAYADRWWNEPNPAYVKFEVNCTNYVSQCLFAGHAPMNYTGRRDSGWWYKGRSGGRELWSYSWAVSHALQSYLAKGAPYGLRGVRVESPSDLALGDVIFYDWDGDGRFQHSTIVTAFDSAGMPLVNANTTASRHRYWDYRDSYAWTERTRYRFFHIADEF